LEVEVDEYVIAFLDNPPLTSSWIPHQT
jgi:hypothetical protein